MRYLGSKYHLWFACRHVSALVMPSSGLDKNNVEVNTCDCSCCYVHESTTPKKECGATSGNTSNRTKMVKILFTILVLFEKCFPPLSFT